MFMVNCVHRHPAWLACVSVLTVVAQIGILPSRIEQLFRHFSTMVGFKIVPMSALLGLDRPVSIALASSTSACTI